MLLHFLILLFAGCSLFEVRRQETRIIDRFIERGRQQIPESLDSAEEDHRSLRHALHASKLGLWIAAVFCMIDIVSRIFLHE
jgi:hypothetical protein